MPDNNQGSIQSQEPATPATSCVPVARTLLQASAVGSSFCHCEFLPRTLPVVGAGFVTVAPFKDALPDYPVFFGGNTIGFTPGALIFTGGPGPVPFNLPFETRFNYTLRSEVAVGNIQVIVRIVADYGGASTAVVLCTHEHTIDGTIAVGSPVAATLACPVVPLAEVQTLDPTADQDPVLRIEVSVPTGDVNNIASTIEGRWFADQTVVSGEPFTVNNCEEPGPPPSMCILPISVEATDNFGMVLPLVLGGPPVLALVPPSSGFWTLEVTMASMFDPTLYLAEVLVDGVPIPLGVPPNSATVQALPFGPPGIQTSWLLSFNIGPVGGASDVVALRITELADPTCVFTQNFLNLVAN